MVDTQRLVSRDDRIARMQRDQDRELAASVRPPPPSLPDIPMPDDE
jgi:hypothetical protein